MLERSKFTAVSLEKGYGHHLIFSGGGGLWERKPGMTPLPYLDPRIPTIPSIPLMLSVSTKPVPPNVQKDMDVREEDQLKINKFARNCLHLSDLKEDISQKEVCPRKSVPASRDRSRLCVCLPAERAPELERC